MLVLSRRRDQEIVIGDDIVIAVIEIRGDKVRLGIKAPSDIPVHRHEVYEHIRRQAAASDAESVESPISESWPEG